jgi:hypothetical protein
MCARAPMYHRDGTVRAVAWAYQDITERKKVPGLECTNDANRGE